MILSVVNTIVHYSSTDSLALMQCFLTLVTLFQGCRFGPANSECRRVTMTYEFQICRSLFSHNNLLLLDILYALNVAIFTRLHSLKTSPNKVNISPLYIQSSGFVVHSISLVRIFVKSFQSFKSFYIEISFATCFIWVPLDISWISFFTTKYLLFQ